MSSARSPDGRLPRQQLPLRPERSNDQLSPRRLIGSLPFGSTASPGFLASSRSQPTALGNERRAGANSPSHPEQHYSTTVPSRSTTAPTLYSRMTSNGSTVGPLPPAKISAGHAKLHKRSGSGSGSGSSVPAPPGMTSASTTPSTFPVPFATYEEPFPDLAPTPPLSTTPKTKTYSRKTSAREDQGKIDLSTSVADNERLAGLGIQDLYSRSVADVPFAPPGRRTPHVRTTSISSQMSTGSASFKPSQPFVHPMRQAPRPYTPPTSQSFGFPSRDNEAAESSDVVDDDFRLGHGFRSRRSTSVSSTPQLAPTPLSHTITASDLGYVPKLTNMSQTNVSVTSSKPSHSRRDTGRSQDLPASPSSRVSFDRAFSFASRPSDSDAQTRDERIRTARRKFEEREADKDRKVEREAMRRREADEAKSHRRQERMRRKSEASSEKSRHNHRPGTSSGPSNRGGDRKDSAREKVDFRPGAKVSGPRHDVALPSYGMAGESEKGEQNAKHRTQSGQTGWGAFTAWLRCCGGRSKS